MIILEIIGAVALLGACFGGGVYSVVRYAQEKHPQLWDEFKKAEMGKKESANQ